MVSETQPFSSFMTMHPANPRGFLFNLFSLGGEFSQPMKEHFILQFISLNVFSHIPPRTKYQQSFLMFSTVHHCAGNDQLNQRRFILTQYLFFPSDWEPYFVSISDLGNPNVIM